MRPVIVYRTAAGLALLGVIAHEFIGAPMVLDPLHSSGLPNNIIWLHHFSWHVGTISVLAMSGMYWYASTRPGNYAMAVVATAISAGFALLGVSLALFGDPIVWTTPAPYVWTVVAATGAYGVFVELSSHNKKEEFVTGR
ncbi:MAG: hypothetical protein AAF993_09635 [Pseudomonadota bacterium]